MQRQTTKNTQKQSTRMRLTPQQLLNVQVTEMPINQLEKFVEDKIIENPALEPIPSETVGSDDMPTHEDDLPVQGRYTDGPERVFADTTTFYDKLTQQISEHELNDHQKEIINYMIGSLDSDGLLRKSAESLCDEMVVYENIETTVEEVKEMIDVLQQFDPAGIGAQSLQQCLLIQIDRNKTGRIKQLMHTVIAKYFDDFLKNHWNKLQTTLNIDNEEKEMLQNELRHLNPKPGSSLDETQGFSINRIIPDFIVETSDDGRVSFYLNQGNMPELSVAQSYTDSLENFKNDIAASAFVKKGINDARSLIDALKQRRLSMTLTMEAIIKRQYRFFQDGDENDMKPLRLKDIADDTGLDISTISRVTNEKYAQTRWGIFRLRFFFTDSYTNRNGEEHSTRQIKLVLKEIIDNEDKSHPLSDIALERKMREKGFDIARRTIMKYRDQMGIPKASLRKE